MIEANKDRVLIFPKEVAMTQFLVEKVKAMLGVDARVMIHSIPEYNCQTKAYRIQLSVKNAREAKIILGTDWDDTLDGYTLRKQAYHKELAKAFLSKALELNIEENALVNFFLLVNEICRVLPTDGTHPETYSPHLEMLVESYFLGVLEQKPKEFSNIVTRLSSNKTALRNLIKNKVFNLSSQLFLENKLEQKDGKEKYYFKELQPMTSDADFVQRPAEVREEVWRLFLKKMTENNLSVGEVAKLKLKEDVYWILSTFGNINFQIEKVLNGLAELKAHKQRIPDEIIVITQGRKGPFLMHFFEKILQVMGQKIVYLDDSSGQLESLLPAKDRMTLLQAIKAGAKRAKDKTDFAKVNLDEKSLMEIVDDFLE